MFQDLQTYNGDRLKGKCTSSCMMLQKWRRSPNQPFSDLFISSIATKAYFISECACIARYCSSDTLWSASAKTIAYPCPSQSRCLACDNHCMREPHIIKPKKHLRMQDSTGPIALYLQVSFHVCCLTLLTNLLYECIRS